MARHDYSHLYEVKACYKDFKVACKTHDHLLGNPYL